MALSDLVVRQAKATGNAYTLPDIDGLSLAVTAAGGRTWHFRYCWAGKQKRSAPSLYTPGRSPGRHRLPSKAMLMVGASNRVRASCAGLTRTRGPRTPA